jgi:RIO-like serine/threonine protein kinase
MKFYDFVGIEKIPIKRYTENLKNELKKKGVKSSAIYNLIDALSKKRMSVLVTTLHGDFAKENTLIKDHGEIVFTDWHPYKGLITNSIANYISSEDIQSYPYFKKIIRVFPKEVKENIKTYFILSEIDLILKRNRKLLYAIKRIENIK